jgi:hypothetical protein
MHGHRAQHIRRLEPFAEARVPATVRAYQRVHRAERITHEIDRSSRVGREPHTSRMRCSAIMSLDHGAILLLIRLHVYSLRLIVSFVAGVRVNAPRRASSIVSALFFPGKFHLQGLYHDFTGQSSDNCTTNGAFLVSVVVSVGFLFRCFPVHGGADVICTETRVNVDVWPLSAV